MHNHTRSPLSLPLTHMQQRYNAIHKSPTGLPLHQYITIPHLVVTKPITFHSLDTFDPTYLTIPGYRSTPLLIHSTPYLSLCYNSSLSPALDSVNMYIPPLRLSMTRSANTCLQDGRRPHPRVPLGNIQVYGLVRSSYGSWDSPSSPWPMESSS